MNFKYIFALHFVLATLFSTLTQAQSVVSNETSIIQGIFEDHQDLFPILMPDYAIQITMTKQKNHLLFTLEIHLEFTKNLKLLEERL